MVQLFPFNLTKPNLNSQNDAQEKATEVSALQQRMQKSIWTQICLGKHVSSNVGGDSRQWHPAKASTWNYEMHSIRTILGIEFKTTFN